MKALIWIALVCAALTSGCSKPLTPTYAGYQNLRMAKLGFAENIIATEVKLYNPNPYPLQVKEASLDLYLNNRFVGSTQFNTLINLVAKDTTLIPLQIKASAKDLLRGTAPILVNPDVQVRIEGKVKAGRKGFFVNVPVNYEGRQRIDLLRDTSGGTSNR
jgi:LEA14-like dessication related protein